MPTRLPFFQEKLNIAVQRLMSRRPARGTIFLCDDQAKLDTVALKMSSAEFDPCWHVTVALAPDTSGMTNLNSLLTAFQTLLAAKAAMVSDEIVLQLADALQPEVSPGPHGLEELTASIFTELGAAAKSENKVLLVTLCDLHRLKRNELTMMLFAVHRSNQLQLPVLVCGTGLSSARQAIGEAAGYGERLFEFVVEPTELQLR